MQPSDINFLDAVEADNCAILCKARWDETAAANIVPHLVAILDSDNRNTLLRTLRAFVTIGPLACNGATKIAYLLRSPEISVFEAAAIALARISLSNPEAAVRPLVQAADLLGRDKYVMLALIELGVAAKSSSPVFERNFADRSAAIRRLALRGLFEIGAKETLLTLLPQAATDKSKEIREYASKLKKRLGLTTR